MKFNMIKVKACYAAYAPKLNVYINLRNVLNKRPNNCSQYRDWTTKHVSELTLWRSKRSSRA